MSGMNSVHYDCSALSVGRHLGKPHISIFSTRNVICSFGGGGFVAVTFLCKHHGKIR